MDLFRQDAVRFPHLALLVLQSRELTSQRVDFDLVRVDDARGVSRLRRRLRQLRSDTGSFFFCFFLLVLVLVRSVSELVLERGVGRAQCCILVLSASQLDAMLLTRRTLVCELRRQLGALLDEFLNASIIGTRRRWLRRGTRTLGVIESRLELTLVVEDAREMLTHAVVERLEVRTLDEFGDALRRGDQLRLQLVDLALQLVAARLRLDEVELRLQGVLLVLLDVEILLLRRRVRLLLLEEVRLVRLLQLFVTHLQTRERLLELTLRRRQLGQLEYETLLLELHVGELRLQGVELFRLGRLRLRIRLESRRFEGVGLELQLVLQLSIVLQPNRRQLGRHRRTPLVGFRETVDEAVDLVLEARTFAQGRIRLCTVRVRRVEMFVRSRQLDLELVDAHVEVVTRAAIGRIAAARHQRERHLLARTVRQILQLEMHRYE